MLSTRSLSVGTVLFPLTILLGCASAGPDLNGPDGPDFMAAYSGDWVLLPSESEDLNGKMRDSMRGSAGASGGGRMTGGRSGGGGGGMTGGGGMRGGRPGGSRGGGMAGGDMDPEEMRRSMEAIRNMASVPGEVSLTLRPETVTFTQNDAAALVLTLGAGKEEIRQGGVMFEASAKWTKSGLKIDREMEIGGGVEDKVSVNEEGNLVFNREINLMGRTVKGILVYQRKSDEG